VHTEAAERVDSRRCSLERTHAAAAAAVELAVEIEPAESDRQALHTVSKHSGQLPYQDDEAVAAMKPISSPAFNRDLVTTFDPEVLYSDNRRMSSWAHRPTFVACFHRSVNEGLYLLDT